jgi:predicted phage-related endonuclease
MNKQELVKKVRELKELQVMADELQAEINTLQDELKAELTSQNLTELQVDVFKIRYTPVTSNRFDTTAFKKVYSELYNQFTKVIESKRFSIV